MPDRNIGIFIASNSFSGIHNKLLSQLLDRYFPVANEAPPIKRYPLSDAQLDRFAGTYRDLEYPRDTFAKVSAPFKQINIKKGANGTLVIQRPRLFFLGNTSQVQLVPIEPMLFRHANDDTLTAFGEDQQGKIAFAFNPLWAKIGTYERVPWYANVWLHLGIIAACAVLFLSAAIVYPGSSLVHWLRRKQFRLERQESKAWQLAGLTGMLNLVFLIGLPLSLWLMGVWKLVYGVPAIVVALLCIPVLTVPLTIGMVFFTVIAWKNKLWSVVNRSHYSLITSAAIALIPLLAYWNLLGFQF